jgi:ABC-type lipoprotein release transport system permease subunit
MTRLALVQRSLLHHRGANLAVIAGVATAVAVLAGALLVGESVRASLRRIALERLGNTNSVITGAALFREALAGELGGAPMLVLEGLVTHQSTNRRASGVAVYAVDERFWKFHGVPSPGLANRDAAMSPELAQELGAKAGDTLLLRLEKPTDIPAESVFGRKEAAAPAIRFTAKTTLGASQLGEFALRPQQGGVKALFIPLARLQKELEAEDRINTILSARTGLEAALREKFMLEDLGLRLRIFSDRGSAQLESATGVFNDALAAAAMKAASEAGAQTTPIFTYMATAIQANGRQTPYSLVAALDLHAIGSEATDPDAIVLNDWAAQDLAIRPGDSVTMDFLVWQDSGRMTTEHAEFTAAAPVPMKGLANDRDVAPRYPGITDAKDVSSWDPPFPMDLSKIRPKDEDYWDKYNTTPKAFIPLAAGQGLWKSRWGRLTAIRFSPVEAAEPLRARLRASLDPVANGLVAIPLREQSLAASRGATDFGEYFSYFSFFLMAAALMLAGLFFRLSVEQRASEVGLLRAVGFSPAAVRRLFLTEGVLLASAGALVGLFAAVAYAALVLFGLSTWWVDAVGTRDLRLALSPVPLLGGTIGALLAAIGAIAWTLRGLRDISPRQLLAGQITAYTPDFRRSRGLYVALVCGALAGVALFSLPAAAGFFSAGLLLLFAALALLRSRLAASLRTRVASLATLAVRNAGYRPGRTVLAAALIASATFLIVSVDAFRRDPDAEAHEFPLIAESVRPLYHDPNSAEGRQELNLPETAGVRYFGFRLRPGDDASCLNLYEPRNPRILGVPARFRAASRWVFADTEGGADAWSLLESPRQDGAIPAFADANSLQYVLHRSLGDELVLPSGQRLRFVAALSDSVFQSEVLISESNFLRAFPSEQGFRVFLIDAPKKLWQPLIEQLESALSDHGFDASLSASRLASFHRVENTYLSTFQSLGALGLLLGTVGLAAVLIRNVLERRRELALLSAVGYAGPALQSLVLRENVFVLAVGLSIGAVCAVVAILPALNHRGGALPIGRIGLLLAAVFATGLLAAWLAARAALKRQALTTILRAG